MLSSLVETELRERSSEDFAHFMHELYRRVFDLVNSGDKVDRIAGILAIGWVA